MLEKIVCGLKMRWIYRGRIRKTGMRLRNKRYARKTGRQEDELGRNKRRAELNLLLYSCRDGPGCAPVGRPKTSSISLQLVFLIFILVLHVQWSHIYDLLDQPVLMMHKETKQPARGEVLIGKLMVEQGTEIRG